MKNDSNEDRALIDKAQRNPKNFGKIYERYFPKIYSFVYQRVNEKHLVDDFVSEIFENAFKSLSDFKWQGISPSAWLFRIARNHLIDYYRKTGKIKGQISLENVHEIVNAQEKSTSEEIELDEEIIELYNALREFSEEDQYMIYYKFFEDMSNKEVSEIMSISESNVGTRLHRIRKKMKKLLPNLSI